MGTMSIDDMFVDEGDAGEFDVPQVNPKSRPILLSYPRINSWAKFQ